MRAAIAILILFGSLAAAHALGLGKEGKMFGRLGAISNKKTAAAPTTPCTSTGIYDLSNVCNDIYFIGAMK